MWPNHQAGSVAKVVDSGLEQKNATWPGYMLDTDLLATLIGGRQFAKQAENRLANILSLLAQNRRFSGKRGEDTGLRNPVY